MKVAIIELNALKAALSMLEGDPGLRAQMGVDANTVWMTKQILPASVRFSFELPPTIKRPLGLVIGKMAIEEDSQMMTERLLALKAELRATGRCSECKKPRDHTNGRECRPCGEYPADVFPKLSPGQLVPIGVCAECGGLVHPL